MEKKKVLIVVDAQEDFCNESGSLYVNGASDCVKEISKMIREVDKYDKVVFTIDWHTIIDNSFKENGGIWPRHCVQNTVGASLSKIISDSLQPEDFSRIYFSYKGSNPEFEEYGAFSYITVVYDSEGKSVCLENYPFSFTISRNFKYTYNSKVILPLGCDLVIVGVAGDYCVLETLKNLVKESKLFGSISVAFPGIASIDGGQALENYLSDHPEIGIIR